ncbi:UNVERIFIED_ORG: site-specific recombinase XerD [Ensifer adhaerens]|nr:site-specific recombinase XerD [Ensifer adhaerens]
MTFAGPDFEWFGETRPRMPVIRWPNGTLCEPLIFFFGHLCRKNFEAIKSMEPRAYSLREWFAYLSENGIPWNQASDLTLHQWRQHERNNGASPEQVEIKLKRVFHFYRHMPDAMVCQPDGTMTPEFVGENKRGEPPRFPISTKEVKTKTGYWLTVWSGSKPIKQMKPNLVVLVNDDRDRVLSELRSPSKPKKNLNDIDSIIKRERDWGMGRAMAGAGLRAHEIPTTSLLDLTKAMKDEQLFRGLGRERAAALRSVAELADDPEAQKIVLKGLKHFTEKRKRLYIGVRVVGKGNKERRAGFTVDLLYDLLTVVVWGGRNRLIKRWQAADPEYVPEDTLFLSFKTGKPLTEGAVSDIMLQAFIDANVSGSGHDLRKNYATNIAAKILTRNLQLFGYFTHAVLNTVLSEVADALGHAKVNTTTQHYTNLAVATATGLENKRQRDKVMRVCDMLLENDSKDMLDDDRIRLCGTAIKVFSEMPKDCELFEILAGAMEETELNPGGLINLSAVGKRVPYLRLVADNTHKPL